MPLLFASVHQILGGKMRIIFAAIVALSMASTGQAARFVAHEIQPFAGDNYVDAYRINDDGVLVGTSSNEFTSSAFIWDRVNGARRISLPGANSSAGGTINNGGIATLDIDGHGYIWSEAQGLKKLKSLTRNDTASGRFVNDDGSIAGTVTVLGQVYAAIWDDADSKPTIIGAPSFSGISGGENSGFYVGIMGSGANIDGYNFRGFVWSENDGLVALPSFGTYQRSPFFSTNHSNARDARSDGTIVGYATAADGEHATIWTLDGSIRSLGDLAGGRHYSRARSINSKDQVVGFGDAGFGLRATIWDDLSSRPQDLNDLIAPGANFILEGAHDINERGDIVATGRNSAGEFRAYVLMAAAIPEPRAWTLFIAGFGIAGAAIRRASRTPAVFLTSSTSST
jgi:hypothetical protein